MNPIWKPKGHFSAPVITPGIHVIEILSIQEGRTPKQSRFMLKIKAEVLGQIVEFVLIWGVHVAVDVRNGRIVARLHEIAALPLTESPNWGRLAEELAGVPLEAKVGLSTQKMEPQLHLVIGEATEPDSEAEPTTEETVDDIRDVLVAEDNSPSGDGGNHV